MENLLDKLAKRIGKRITKVRSERGLTAEKLAYENGISKGYLSELENGLRLPSLKMLEKIAHALDVDIKDLL